MKKIIMGWICLLLCGGCYNSKAMEEDYTYLLFATPLKEHAIWLQAKAGFDQACDDYDIKCDWLGPTVIDTEEMSNVIATGILQDADGIITQGVVSAELINRAKEEGIPMVLVDSDVSTSDRLAYIGKDFHAQAQLLLVDVEKRYGKEKPLKIAIQVAEQSFAIAQDQIREIKEVFASHPGGFEIVAISESKSDPVRAKKEWHRVLAENEEINVAFALAAESAVSCMEASAELQIRNQLLIYGVDETEENTRLVKEGKIDGLIATSFYDYGYESVEIIMRYLENKKLPKQRVYSPQLTLVNKENLDE